MTENQYSSLVVKVAERCNLNCSYCYMYQQGDTSFERRPKKMARATYSAMLARVKKYCEQHQSQMLICFHGGEPLLVGRETMAWMAEQARSVLGGYLGGLKIQTNATLVDDEWAALFKHHRIGVGISMDGPAQIHDRVRVDFAGRGSHAQVARGLEILQAHDLDPTILCVVNPGESGLTAYRHFRQLGVKKILLLMPDVTRDRKEAWYGQFGPTPVADYLIPVFDAWFEEDDGDIKLHPFWDLLTLVRHGTTRNDAFGNPPMGYLIIESDGAIQPLDVLRGCDPDLVETGLNVHTDDFSEVANATPVLNQLMSGGISLCATCQNCDIVDMCGGGYLPHRYAKANGFDNPSTWCADIQKILTHIYDRMLAYAV